MKIERLKRFNIWKWIGIIFVLCLIVFIVTYTTSKAKYRFTESYQAASGTIHWQVADLEIAAVFLEQSDGSYVMSDTIPTSGYALNSTKSYCAISNGDGTHTNVDVNITYSNGEVYFDNITKKGTKCFLYFDIQLSGLDLILANNTVDTSRKSGEFTSVFAEDTAGRIFEGPADDYGDTTYFFAGANPNNWVKFAGFYWRIIRVNGNGSLRLIYNGTDTTTTGTTTQISTSAFNSSYKDNAYVGYMYGTTGSSTYAATHANTNNSTIKGVLDTWYASNIASYSDKIDTSVGFCGDRTSTTSSSKAPTSVSNTGGYGATTTYYGAFYRNYTTSTPSLECHQTNDLYTVSSSSYGNKALTYPIGLITADEVSFAGAYKTTANSSYWLSTNSIYWTMSPSDFLNSNARAFYVYGTGYLAASSSHNSYGVRPVLNLDFSTVFSGLGTAASPFIVG